MLRNYLKIAYRNLVKNKFSSLINIGGLAVGIAVAMLIGLWIYSELSFDKEFKNYGSIARVIQNVSNNGEKDTWEQVPFPLGEELRKSYSSDFKNVVMTTNIGDHILAYDEKKLTGSGGYFEPGIIEMLSLKMLKGTGVGLKDPSSVLLSRSLAKALFENNDPIGKVLKIDNNLTVKIAGVYENLPINSTFAKLNFILPWDLFVTSNDLKSNTNPWRCNCFTSLVQTAENADMDKISVKIKDVKIKKVNKDEVFHKA